ncbi:hypothetical protein LOTGIDRAFT_106953 [Lottia gigantea]|uniref:Dermatopontin n=1 Tax=Lottia gigantea TaxID=225164 RepID=V4BEG9_LOTGI|nr:hypothetical protein LOTGIDRAFT_106953 [Lottia gigantea]ESO87269.1 hypothetical protein LOTGIDRAFT_106953 [Lottia gigantea]
MIILLHTILIFIPLCLAWQNDWDQSLDVYCSYHQSFYRIRSEHDNGKEDRRWQFDCHYIGPLMGGCTWYNDVNGWDAPVNFYCPNNGAMTGVKSRHDNGKEDRIWSYRCCDMPGRLVTTTGFVNGWDQGMDYQVPSNYYITGTESHHDNGKE